MAKLLAALISGILLGVIGMLAADRFGSSNDDAPEQVVRDIVDVPKMTQAVAEQHRDTRYAGLHSIEDVIALPTEFARSEAVYALAGRADPGRAQELIFEANRIADEEERVNLLSILFFRLAETDPMSALALARTEHFSGVATIERTVWRSWARKDLDDALFAAKTQTSLAHQNAAAQSLYAAFGYLGNDITDRIEAELDIGPDRSSRGRYLYRLADRSPGEAIAFINSLERDIEQQEYVSWLAYYVSLRDPGAALSYANQFWVAADGERYRSIINSNVARENPQATIDRMLANGEDRRSSSEFHSAINALASADLDTAKQYFELSRSSEDKRMFGSAIASEMAKTDPVAALAWARANDRAEFSYLEMRVLMQIARTDPQIAMSEALKTPNSQMRSNTVSNVIQQVARTNPAEAITFLDQIQNKQQKLDASQHLASAWIRQDPDAAMEWILSHDKETAGQLAQRAVSRLLHSDIDAAIRLLPVIDERRQMGLRQEIAQQLATNRSPAEAQNYVSQFEGQPGYEHLQASVIAGVAKTDVFMAKQLADQLADSGARDSAYVQVIKQHAQSNPTEAARWLSYIADEGKRGSAAGQLASHWYLNDPAAASRWVTNLPAGAERDDAIMQMSYRWSNSTPEQDKLIASIEDRDKRGQAKVRRIYGLMQTDPEKARKLLEDDDIPSYQRQQVEMRLSQYGSRF